MPNHSSASRGGATARLVAPFTKPRPSNHARLVSLRLSPYAPSLSGHAKGRNGRRRRVKKKKKGAPQSPVIRPSLPPLPLFAPQDRGLVFDWAIVRGRAPTKTLDGPGKQLSGDGGRNGLCSFSSALSPLLMAVVSVTAARKKKSSLSGSPWRIPHNWSSQTALPPGAHSFYFFLALTTLDTFLLGGGGGKGGGADGRDDPCGPVARKTLAQINGAAGLAGTGDAAQLRSPTQLRAKQWGRGLANTPQTSPRLMHCYY
ncbi:hypothetical protein IF2G_01492 [Cordyceps javanica]|nr:hypothetical protein IF2G_01492 [Cordyceps javanica]